MSDVSRETNSFSGNIQQQIALRKEGRRGLVRHGGALCSKCYSGPPAKGQRYCAGCHAKAVSDSYYRKKAEFDRLRAMAQAQEGAQHG